MGQSRSFSTRIRWTAKEEDLLREVYSSTPRSDLKRLFPNRKVQNVETKAHLLGLSKPSRSGRTPEEVRKAKREHMARRRADDVEAARAYGREFYAQNRDRIRAKTKEYQARRFFWMRAMKLSGVSASDLASIWKSQRGLCSLTGRKLLRSDAQVDHIIPRAKGGGDETRNLRWVCSAANLAKRDMTDPELFALCSEILDRMRISMGAAE